MIDVAPTVLEVAGLPEPVFVNGVQQHPIEGSAWRTRSTTPRRPNSTRRSTSRCSGNRGIYHKGWTAVTKHRTPWETGAVKLPAFDDDVWELYDTTKDWSQAKDLAKENPAKLHELQRLWLIEAVKYNVLPLDDRFAERANPDIAGRPQLIKGDAAVAVRRHGAAERKLDRQHQEQVARRDGRGGRAPIRRRGRHHRPGRAHGRLEPLHQGWQAEVLLQLLRPEPLHGREHDEDPAGEHQVRMEFAYDGGGLAKGGTVTLYVDGKKAGEGRVDQTEPMIFSADETCDVGFEAGSPVTPDYPARGTKFSGEVNWVEIAVGKDAEDLDHLISPEERLRVAMALQ